MRGQPIDGYDWCKSYSFPLLQSNPTAVAICLTSLSDRGLSRLSILEAAYGIAWLHKKLVCPNPVDDLLVLKSWLVLNASWLVNLTKNSLLILITSGRCFVSMVTLVLLYRTYKWCRWLRLVFVPSYVGQSCVTYVPVT